MIKRIKKNVFLSYVVSFLLIFLASAYVPAYAMNFSAPKIFAGLKCGGPPNAVIHTTIDFGCQGKGPAILDLVFGVIQFLSDGVGLVVVASLVYAGIQYITSAGDPQAAANAIKRIRSSGVALLLFLFAYALLNYVIPGQVLQ